MVRILVIAIALVIAAAAVRSEFLSNVLRGQQVEQQRRVDVYHGAPTIPSP